MYPFSTLVKFKEVLVNLSTIAHTVPVKDKVVLFIVVIVKGLPLILLIEKG
mgnify:CR=1 FL=1